MEGTHWNLNLSQKTSNGSIRTVLYLIRIHQKSYKRLAIIVNTRKDLSLRQTLLSVITIIVFFNVLKR